MRLRTKDMALCAMLTILALIAHSIENAIPMPLPALRIGLTNVFSLIGLAVLGVPAALSVTLLRVFLSLILFGNTFSFIVSLPSSLGAVLVCIALHHKKEFFTLPWISVAGAASFNILQLGVVGMLMKEPYVFYLLAPLLTIGTVSGWCVGYIAELIEKRLDQAKAHR